MKIHDVLATFQNCTPIGNGTYKARCPLCKLPSDSLIIEDKKERGINVLCETGCEQRSLLKAIRLSEYDILPLGDFGRSQALRELPKQASDGRPIIPLPSRGIELTVTAKMTAEKFSQEEESTGRTLFRKGSQYVRLDSRREATLSPISRETFQSLLQQKLLFVKWKMPDSGPEWTLDLSHILPLTTTNAILASEAFTNSVPHVENIARCPILLPDGILIQNGYDQQTQTLVISKCPQIPHIQLAEAVNRLCALAQDFLFVTEGDKARFIACLISPALRMGGILPNGPMDCFEATESTSGKGYAVRLRAALYADKPKTVVQKSGGVGSFDESIGAALVAGHTFVSLDNIRGHIGSQFFESALTENTVAVRLPYREEILVTASRFMVSFTSNSAEFTPDLANRSNLIRIRKQQPGYQFHQFKDGDLIDHVAANQPFYFACLVSIVREWLRQGKPTAKTNWNGHFRHWWGVMDWVLPNLFQLPPPSEGQIQSAQQTADPAAVFLRGVAAEIFRRGEPDSDGYSASQLAEFAEEANPQVSFFGSEIDKCPQDRRARKIGIQLKRILPEGEPTTVDDFIVTRFRTMVQSQGDSGPTAQVRYSFQRIPQQPQQPQQPV